MTDVTNALSAIAEAVANEFSLAAQAEEAAQAETETTNQVTLTPLTITVDPDDEAEMAAFAEFSAKAAEHMDAKALADEAFAVAVEMNDEAAMDASYSAALAAQQAIAEVANSVFGIPAVAVSVAGQGGSASTGAAAPAGEASSGAGVGGSSGSSGAGSASGNSGGTGQSSGSSVGSNDGGQGTGQGTASGGSGSGPSTGNGGGTVGTAPAPGDTGQFGGSSNPTNAPVSMSDVIGFTGNSGRSAVTATLGDSEGSVSPATAAHVAAVGAHSFSQADVEALGRTIAGEVAASITAKIARGEADSLTDDELQQIGVTVNIAVTRAFADSRVAFGPFGGSIAAAVYAGHTASNAGQFSAFNANTIAATNRSYGRNAAAFNAMAEAFLDGSIASERGLGVAAPVPAATHYFNPDVADPSWGGSLGNVQTFGTSPHSHVAGTLGSEYGSTGQVEGLDDIADSIFSTMTGLSTRGIEGNPASLTGFPTIANPEIAINVSGQVSTVNGSNVTPVDAPAADEVADNDTEDETAEADPAPASTPEADDDAAPAQTDDASGEASTETDAVPEAPDTSEDESSESEAGTDGAAEGPGTSDTGEDTGESGADGEDDGTGGNEGSSAGMGDAGASDSGEGDGAADSETSEEAKGPGVMQAVITFVKDLFSGLFKSEVEQPSFTNFPQHASSTPYIPVVVTIDEDEGSVKLARGPIQNLQDASPVDQTRDLPENAADIQSLVVDANGNIIFSDGTYAPRTIKGVSIQTDTDPKYVYLIERVRNGEVVVAQVNSDALPGNFFTNTVKQIFGNNSPFTISDVKTITYVYVDQEDVPYYDYTITLNDGSTRNVALPVTTSLAFYESQLKRIGYEGDVFALTNLAVQSDVRVEQREAGFLERIVNAFINGTKRLTGGDTEETYTDLGSVSPVFDRDFAAERIESLSVYLNIPVVCPVVGETSGYVYHVELSGRTADGAMERRSAAFVRCGAGGPRTYAVEIAAHIEEQSGLKNIDVDALLEMMVFHYNTPNVSLAALLESLRSASGTDESDDAEAIQNRTNEIVFEAKVTSASGSLVRDWSASNVALRRGEQLHLRWNAAAYARCLPFIADNGEYSLFHGSDIRMTTGNTQATGYDVFERTGSYRIECDGQTNGEEGVDIRTITVTVN